MKTSNKLLLGLVIAFFLIATVLAFMAKKHSVSITNYSEQGKEEAFLELQEEKAEVSANLYFPIAILQPPLQLR